MARKASAKKTTTRKTTTKKVKKDSKASKSDDKELTLDQTLDKIDKDAKLLPIQDSENTSIGIDDALPTGCLVLDLALGGGWAPGKIVGINGPEHAGKTTLLYHSIRTALGMGVRCNFYDAEGSLDRSYMERIGIEWSMYRNKDERLLRLYRRIDTGEQVFAHIRKTLKVMPDKDEGDISMLFVLDSAAALLPESEKEEAGGMLFQAKMFSNELRSTKVLIARKRALLIITNQIRYKPMAFGNPEYSPGGEALKHYTDQRVKIKRFSKSLKDSKTVKGVGTGGIERETHVSGHGEDRYAYSAFTTEKNKAFSPWQTGEMRIWFSEQNESGRGVDPVYDVFHYLALTGQVVVVGKLYKISLPGFEGKYTWKDFKRTVLLPGMKAKIGGVVFYEKDSRSIWDACRDQIAACEAFRLKQATDANDTEIVTYRWAEVKEVAKDGDDIIGVTVEFDDGSTTVIKIAKLTEKAAASILGHMVEVPM